MKYSVSLKSNRDFRRLYSRGKRAVCPTLVLYVQKNRQGRNRLGITVSKKLGRRHPEQGSAAACGRSTASTRRSFSLDGTWSLWPGYGASTSATGPWTGIS